MDTEFPSYSSYDVDYDGDYWSYYDTNATSSDYYWWDESGRDTLNPWEDYGGDADNKTMLYWGDDTDWWTTHDNTTAWSDHFNNYNANLHWENGDYVEISYGYPINFSYILENGIEYDLFSGRDFKNITYYFLSNFNYNESIGNITVTPVLASRLIHPSMAVVAGLAFITSVINTITYKKMGNMEENILFLSLSAMDSINLLVAFALGVSDCTDYPIQPKIIVSQILQLIIVIFQNWTCWMTVYLTTQRCICITFPFKVKTLFTTRRNVIYIVGMFIACLITTSLSSDQNTHYKPNTWMPRFAPITFYSLTSAQTTVVKALDYTVYIISPWLAIVINFFMTCFLAIRLYASGKWRKSITSGHAANMSEDGQGNSGALNKKEVKIIRLVLAISIVFFLTYTPSSVVRLIFLIKPELIFQPVYFQIDEYYDEVDTILKSINSGTNIIFFYTLSSRYKAEFRKLFGCKEIN